MELGLSDWDWLVLLEPAWDNAEPDAFDPAHSISWLVEQEK